LNAVLAGYELNSYQLDQFALAEYII